MRTLTLKAVSEALGAEWGRKPQSVKVQITVKRGEHPDFPVDVDSVTGDPLFNLDEVREWFNAKIASRGRSRRPAPADRTAYAELTAQEEALVVVLADPDSSEVDKQGAAYSLACLRVAKSYKKGDMGARELEDIKKASEELRRARAAYMEIEERGGMLIERAVACAAAGKIATMLNNAFDRMRLDLAVQIELWAKDAIFAAMDTEARGRAVREWCDAHGRELRTLTADGIAALVERERADLALESHGENNAP